MKIPWNFFARRRGYDLTGLRLTKIMLSGAKQKMLLRLVKVSLSQLSPYQQSQNRLARSKSQQQNRR